MFDETLKQALAGDLGQSPFPNFVGQHFLVREYIRNQEHEDERLDQMGLWR